MQKKTFYTVPTADSAAKPWVETYRKKNSTPLRAIDTDIRPAAFNPERQFGKRGRKKKLPSVR